jgi:hypothetical protein
VKTTSVGGVRGYDGAKKLSGRNRGRPPYIELGRAASFGDLPEGCKNLVLDMYQKMWNLSVTNVGFRGI